MNKTIAWAEGTFVNMTEPFTVMLTNEAQQFATDSNRKVTSAQSYYTDIIVIRGSQERTDYTIGNITSGSGITVSKNSKRVTFSVSAGTTIGADAGVIEIPITLDGQTVKKQFSWSCGKQGPQGVKGQDGTSVKITSKSVTYQTSTSGTTAPTGTWLTTVPTVNNGQYLWTKTTVQYSDGNKTEAYSVSYKGTNGTNGTSVTVSKTEVTYQVSTSGTTAPTGAWSTTMPTCDQGQYLWTKTYVKYSDGKETTSYSVSYKGVDGEKFSWNLIQNGKGNEKRGFFKNFSSVNITEGYGEITLTSKHNYIGIGLSGFVLTPRQYEVGEKITWSYDIMYTKWDFPTGSNRQELWMGQRYTNAASGETATGQWVGVTAHDLPVVGQNGCELNKWFHVEVTKTIPAQASSNVGYQGIINFYNSTDISATVTLRMKNVKLEYGDTATPWSPAQSDLEGRGVSQTVQYYLATSQASGVTSSTSGWSTDITTQKLTADKKYLWNCYQTKYSDGTSEPISTPKVIGVYGDKGQNAKNLSITPSSQYFKSTDGGKTFAPNAITIKPTIQGEISFGKWQYSIDGGVSFADVVSGQKGLTVSNNVLAVSKDSSLYSDAVTMVIFRAVADDSSFYDTCSIAKIYDVSDIGDGRNLLWNSNFAKTDEAITGTTNSWGLHTRGTNLVASIDTSTKHNGFNTLKTVSAANGDKNSSNDLEWFAWGISERTSNNLHSKNQNYTLSFYAKASVTTDFIVRWGYDAYGADTTRTLTTNWQKYEIKLHQATSAYSITIIFKLLTAGTVWFSEFKLEKGSSATGYSTAPEDLQTAILSTKSEISDVSLKVDKNKQAIEQRVEKTTYQQDLNLVKGDISKANEGLNKWRYEIYPKSLFASEYQGKSTMDVFAKNTNLTPSQSVLINDTDLSIAWNYDNNYIGYALTFAKFSAAKSVAITFAHDDGAHIYLNGKLIGGSDAYNNKGESLTLGFVKGWNCIEVVVNEGASTEGFKLGTTISAISECQLMNCYYGTPVARQSHITNQLVENTTNIDGISTKVSKVTSVIGDNGENFTSFKNDYSDFKQTMNGFKTTVGQTYVTKDDFNGLEIGGRNLVRLGGLSSNGATSFSYDKTTDIYTIVSPVVSTVWGIGAAVKYDDNHKVLIPYGKTYILSFEVKVPQALSINIDINNFAVSGSSWAGNDNDDGSMRGQSSYNIPANTWTKVWVRWANTNTKNTNKVDLYDNSSIGLVTKDCTSAITWQIRHVKGELGNKPTDWTPAPEDVNGKIVNVETIANQTAKKFEWIVKGGDSSSNFTLTDRVADLVAERINFKGLVTFSGLNTDAKNEIGKVAQSKVDGLEVGGRNLLKHSSMIGEKLVCDNYVGCNNCDTKEYTNEGFHIITPTKGNANNGIAFSFDNFTILGINGGDTITFSCDIKGTSDSHAPFVSIHISDNDWYGSDVIQKNTSVSISSSWQRVSVTLTTPTGLSKNHMWLAIHGNYQSDLYVRNFKLEKGNKATDWMPAPEDVSQDASNKANQALTDAKNYSSNAVNWVTNNGSSTTSLNSMVKKWTDGAVSDTTQINGGWIKANTITASKIAIGDFTNYCQLNKDTASSYGFTATDDIKGVWFTASPIDRDKDISQWFTCEGCQKLYVEYDLSTTVKGKLKASDTDISYLTSGIMIFVTNGTKEIISYTRSKGVTATSDGAITHISLVETLPADARFFKVVLQTDGQRNTFSGTLKIRNPQVRKATTGKLIVDGSITADKIATDAIKSRNYISSGGTQGSFLNLSDGSFTSPNLSWDSNGNLIAKNANLSGEITATNGSIAGWTIISNKMYTTGSGKYTGIGKYGSAYAFWAGATSNDNGNSAVFKVSHTGKLTATDADITGTITATNGKIGRYDITSTYLMTNSGSNASGIGGNQAFWAGAEDSNSAPFRVGYDGVLWAENAAIRGSIETGNLGDEGDTVSIINGHIGIQGTSNNVEIYSTGFKFGIDGDYYLESVSEGVKCYRNLYATDFIADGWIYNASGGHYTWKDRDDAYISCGDYNGHNVYYYANYHAFYVNKDSGQGMMYINTNGVTSRVGFTKTSDERIKKNFESFDDNIIDAYMNIEPVKYQLKQSSNDKYHFGFKAQHIDKIFSDYGDTYNESFDICTSRPIDPDKAKELYGVDGMVEEYGLRYDELIAPTTYMVQHIYKELEQVKQEKADLETRLQAIEAKLRL